GGFGRLRAAGGEAECFRGKRGQNIIRPDRDQRRWRAGKKRSRTWFIRTMLIRTMLGRTRLGRTGADSAGRAAMEPSEDSRPDDHPAVRRRSGGFAVLFPPTPPDSGKHRRA